MKKNPPATACVCGSGRHSEMCCVPLIAGRIRAPTAEALMRSRYTAYCQGNERYLLDSWHRSTRPERIELDPAIQWLRLKILVATHDRVEFIATCRINGKAHKLHEDSRFIYEDGNWFYLDAIRQPD